MKQYRIEYKQSVDPGFTLLEVLAAVAMSAMLLSSLYIVMSSAIRLREDDNKAFQDGPRRSQVAALLKHDLMNCAAPGGVLAGAMIGTKVEEIDRREDALEIYTTTGRLDDEAPWADIQKIQYALAAAEDPEQAYGKDLVRTLTRNLLASTEAETEEQRLLHGVRSLELYYYDGETWQDTWDGTTQEETMPEAVKFIIGFEPPLENERENLPLEVVAAVIVRSASTSETGQTADAGGPEGGGAP